MRQERFKVAVTVEIGGVSGRKTFEGISSFARAHNWDLSFDLRGGSMAASWHDQRYDGYIDGNSSNQVFEQLSSYADYTVTFSQRKYSDKTNSVLIDDQRIGAMAAEYFINRGFRHFAYFGPEQRSYSGLRQKGFTECLKGYRFEEHTLTNPDADKGISFSMAYDENAEFLSQQSHPLALFACNDYAAYYILQLCDKHQIAVPEKVAVLGADNDEILCRNTKPPLSSVEPDFFRAGYLSAHQLHTLMNGKQPETESHLVGPLKVYTRQSTDVVAIEDPVVAEAVRWIRNHACRAGNVKELVNEMQVGRRLIERRFDKILGRSPHQEIMRVRIERAVELLLETNMNIAELAPLTGFSCLQHLNKAFLKFYNMTPATYRKMHAAESDRELKR